jgi:hypothetical protein
MPCSRCLAGWAMRAAAQQCASSAAGASAASVSCSRAGQRSRQLVACLCLPRR